MNEVRTHTLFSEYDIHLFKAGKHFRLYQKLGNHLLELDGVQGTFFAVWAPSARSVSVIGDFNFWDNDAHKLFPRPDGSGIWEGFIPDVGKGDIYKYGIHAQDGRQVQKGDPYGIRWEAPPKTGSIVWDSPFDWKDNSWMKKRKKKNSWKAPFAVYEVHLGSWKTKEDGTSLTYLELAEELVAYVKEMGFTHVEFMPVMEHPYTPSWGYQITGFYAPTSRFGNPEDFKYLVNAFHKAGIGVILDWVPSHFPADRHGLADFDGTHLFDHSDPKQGFHPDWKSCIFNYGRNEVRSFLISNALFWLDVFHIDGFRVDAVASMLYLDYSREEGEWVPNKYGGKENLEAIAFLKEFNEMVYSEYPDVVTIAEESTSWAGVSHPTDANGLGFGQKWMMGWMHDTLDYFSKDPLFRRFEQDKLTFSQLYAYTENFMLPFSHDEVVHGKASLLYKMPGDEWQRFANLRLMYGYMYTHPGTKLLFMGGEFGQSNEWNFKTQLDWHLLDHDFHKGVQKWVRDLNKMYQKSPALYEQQFTSEGFQWGNVSDRENSIISYFRKGKNGEHFLVVGNFTPLSRENYMLGVPMEGQWKQILCSDDKKYGGSGAIKKQNPKTIVEDRDGMPYSVQIIIPPLSAVVFEWVG